MQYLSFCNWLVSLSLTSMFLLNDTIKRDSNKYTKICNDCLWVVGLNMVFKNSFSFSLLSNYVDAYFLSNTQVTILCDSFLSFNWSVIALRCC